MLKNLLDWIDDRTGLVSLGHEFMDEKIPASSGWHQVFGSVALFVFAVQILTGILLTINYAPQPGAAFLSIEHIMTSVTAGYLIRGLHHWGSSVMIIIVVLHMAQVAIWGAYKRPREATWLVGIVLLLLTFAFGLTGYLLTWDNRAYWATVVTVQIAGLAPGGALVQRLLGSADGTVGVSVFQRFFALHTMLLPALTAGLAGFHVYLVRRHGVAPQLGDESKPKKPFYPEQVFKDTAAIFVVFAILFGLALILGAPMGRPADPTDSSVVPRPEWYFLFLFQILKYFPGALEVVGAIILPTLALLALAALPFIDRGKLAKVGQRKTAIGLTVACFAVWGGLTMAALSSSPAHEEELAQAGAWSRVPPSAAAGLASFGEAGCRECHDLAPGGEPKLGPALGSVTMPKSAYWIVEHLENPARAVSGSSAPKPELAADRMKELASLAAVLTPENAEDFENAPAYVGRGALLYQQNVCGMCHVTNGEGQQMGPPMSGLAQTRTAQWMADHFRSPQELVPGSVMPPYNFADEDMDAIVQYLLALP